MPRSKSGSNSRRKLKKLFRMAKGNWGGHRRVKKQMRETVNKGMAHAYNNRHEKKQDFRSLWIMRINAACRQNEISYSRFIDGLKKAGIGLNRKALADIAVRDPQSFTSMVQLARKQLTA